MQKAAATTIYRNRVLIGGCTCWI